MEQLVNPICDEPVISPADGSTITDPIMILALKEGATYITKRGKLVIQWPQFMKSRRKYRDAPEYAKLTPSQLSLYWRLREGNFMSIAAVRLIMNVDSNWKIWELLKAKGVPIYKFPPNDQIRILSTDFIQMVDSCKIDVQAEGGVWNTYIARTLQLEDLKKKRDTKTRFCARRSKRKNREESATRKAGAASRQQSESDQTLVGHLIAQASGPVPASASAENTGTNAAEQRES